MQTSNESNESNANNTRPARVSPQAAAHRELVALVREKRIEIAQQFNLWTRPIHRDDIVSDDEALGDTCAYLSGLVGRYGDALNALNAPDPVTQGAREIIAGERAFIKRHSAPVFDALRTMRAEEERARRKEEERAQLERDATRRGVTPEVYATTLAAARVKKGIRSAGKTAREKAKKGKR